MVKAFISLLIILFCMSTAVAKKVEKPEVTLRISKEIVWQREQVIVTLDVISNDTLSRLDSKPFEQNGFTIMAYEQQIKEKDNKQTLRLKWALFPLTSDTNRKKVEISLPRIRYRPSSGRPMTLDLQPLLLTIKPLPIYVPPTMPVGKVSLKSEWNNGRVVFTKKLLNWHVSATAKKVAPQTLPALSRYFQDTENLLFLPLKKATKVEKEQHAIEHQQSYQIPIKALSLGRLPLPEVAVQYFNPETGLIEKVALNQPIIFVINRWLVLVMIILLLAVIVFLWVKILPRIQALLKKRLQMKQALQALKSAKNYSQIQNALMQYAFASSGKKNISFDQFVVNSDLNKQDRLAFEALIEKLQIGEFSTRENNKQCSEISEGLFRILR